VIPRELGPPDSASPGGPIPGGGRHPHTPANHGLSDSAKRSPGEHRKPGDRPRRVATPRAAGAYASLPGLVEWAGVGPQRISLFARAGGLA
jgi:hypothetical protein